MQPDFSPNLETPVRRQLKLPVVLPHPGMLPYGSCHKLPFGAGLPPGPAQVETWELPS
jgi:hypothetical protein